MAPAGGFGGASAPKPCYAPGVFVEPLETAPAVAPRWRLSDLWLGLAVLTLSFLGAATALALAVEEGWIVSGDEAPGIAATIAFELVVAVAVVLLAFRRNLGWRGLGFVRPRRWGPLAVAWAGAYVALIGYAALIALIESFGADASAISGNNAIELEDDERTLGLVVLLGVAVVIVAPLAEELFFRGLWYRGLRDRWGMPTALLVSGGLFGLFHLNAGVIIPFSLVGIIFAWANEESGSLWTSIGAHAGFNGVSYVLSMAGAGA